MLRRNRGGAKIGIPCEPTTTEGGWKAKLRQSSDDFARLIEPIAARVLVGQFEIVEGVTNVAVAQALDRQAGIDLWFVSTKGGVRGVANRVQRTTKNWRTFTVRNRRDSGVETEYAKRVRALKHEWLYPVLTLQAYVNLASDKLLGFGVARTRDIISFIASGRCRERRTGAGQVGQASFYVVEWDALKTDGYTVYEYPEGG